MPLSHLDESLRPRIVDVSAKVPTARRAVAEALVRLPAAARAALDGEGRSAKGPVFQVAELAGLQAAKRTAELIPLCHPLPLDHVAVSVRPDAADDHVLRVRAEARATHRTGVEMEALVAASVASLAVYDMLKAASPGIVVESVRLLEKTGGKADWSAPSAVPPCT